MLGMTLQYTCLTDNGTELPADWSTKEYSVIYWTNQGRGK